MLPRVPEIRQFSGWGSLITERRVLRAPTARSRPAHRGQKEDRKSRCDMQRALGHVHTHTLPGDTRGYKEKGRCTPAACAHPHCETHVEHRVQHAVFTHSPSVHTHTHTRCSTRNAPTRMPHTHPACTRPCAHPRAHSTPQRCTRSHNAPPTGARANCALLSLLQVFQQFLEDFSTPFLNIFSQRHYHQR